MTACAVLAAALAVQPALGLDAGKSKRKAASAAPAHHAAAAKRKAARAAAPARGATTVRRRTTRQAPATAAVDPTQAPVDAAPVATPPVDPAPPVDVPVDAPPTTVGPEDGATGAQPPTTAQIPALVESPAPPPPPPPVVQLPRTPTADETATGPATPTPTLTPTAGAEDRDLVQAVTSGVTSQPIVAATASETSALDAPAGSASGTANPGQTAGPDGSALSPTANGGRAQARGAGGTAAATTDAATGGTAPRSAISNPLRTPASARILGNGVRVGGDTETSLPPPAGGDVKSLGSPTKTVFTRVGNAVNVIPQWMWIALAVLGGLVLLLAANTVIATARTRRLERQREKLMEDIGLLQAALLPAVPARMGALLTTVAYRPADGPAAGGDFYDAFPLPDGKVALLLGDVSGHGRQALAKTTLVRFTVRAHLEAGMSPREAIAIAGRSLDGRLADDFSTVLAAIHDPATGTLTYASAGHPPPLVLGPSAHPPVTVSSAPPIGVGFPTGQRQTMVPMPEGTTVAVYSDGLLEARIAGEPLGAERLAAWLADLGPEATAKQLLDLVVQRADRVSDDLAAVVIHAAPGATAPASRVEQLKLDVLDVDGPDLEGFLKAAGVSRGDRAIAGRRVSEQLAIAGGVIVEVRTGEHPTVSVYAIGDRTAAAQRQSSPAR
jgi:serine phosphatase RsbU (regulator of sigma subunit)